MLINTFISPKKILRSEKRLQTNNSGSGIYKKENFTIMLKAVNTAQQTRLYLAPTFSILYFECLKRMLRESNTYPLVFLSVPCLPPGCPGRQRLFARAHTLWLDTCPRRPAISAHLHPGLRNGSGHSRRSNARRQSDQDDKDNHYESR